MKKIRTYYRMMACSLNENLLRVQLKLCDQRGLSDFAAAMMLLAIVVIIGVTFIFPQLKDIFSKFFTGTGKYIDSLFSLS